MRSMHNSWKLIYHLWEFLFIYLFYTNLNDISPFLLIIIYKSNGDQKETLTLTQLSLGMKFLNIASEYLLLAASTALWAGIFSPCNTSVMSQNLLPWDVMRKFFISFTTFEAETEKKCFVSLFIKGILVLSNANYSVFISVDCV